VIKKLPGKSGSMLGYAGEIRQAHAAGLIDLVENDVLMHAAQRSSKTSASRRWARGPIPQEP